MARQEAREETIRSAFDSPYGETTRTYNWRVYWQHKAQQVARGRICGPGGEVPLTRASRQLIGRALGMASRLDAVLEENASLRHQIDHSQGAEEEIEYMKQQLRTLRQERHRLWLLWLAVTPVLEWFRSVFYNMESESIDWPCGAFAHMAWRRLLRRWKSLDLPQDERKNLSLAHQERAEDLVLQAVCDEAELRALEEELHDAKDPAEYRLRSKAKGGGR
jgi:hypothetical protein